MATRASVKKALLKVQKQLKSMIEVATDKYDNALRESRADKLNEEIIALDNADDYIERALDSIEEWEVMWTRKK